MQTTFSGKLSVRRYTFTKRVDKDTILRKTRISVNQLPKRYGKVAK